MVWSYQEAFKLSMSEYFAFERLTKLSSSYMVRLQDIIRVEDHKKIYI